MSEFDRAFEAFRSQSAPRPTEVEAMRQRLGRSPPPRRVPLALAAGIVLALAGAAAFSWSKLHDRGEVPRVGDDGAAIASAAAPPRMLQLPLREAGEAHVTPRVALQWAGEGEVAGEEQAPRIAWLQGTLHVDVEPEHSIDLVVATDEARVQVHGTAFSVTRDAMGTAVAVDHGVVSVECAGGAKASLTVGMSTSCRPVRAAPLLRRARALQDSDPAAALADVDEALRDTARPPLLDDELLAVRVALLGRTGRNAEAVAAAVAYVAGGGSRADEVARLGLALGASGAEARALSRGNE